MVPKLQDLCLVIILAIAYPTFLVQHLACKHIITSKHDVEHVCCTSAEIRGMNREFIGMMFSISLLYYTEPLMLMVPFHFFASGGPQSRLLSAEYSPSFH
jgi:hypothetical protein